MVAILVEKAFVDERVIRVVAHTDPDNPGSGRVLEKNGFRRAGRPAFLDQGEKLFWVLARGDRRA
jgi:RimJ/RimL family protein N-acetyltransferase